jgi:hypothetical protein
MGRNIVHRGLISKPRIILENIPEANTPDKPLPDSPQPAQVNAVPDNYVSQIVKLIPTEIVGVYLGIQNLLSSLTEPTRAYSQFVIFLVILGITPFYLKLAAAMTDKKQLLIAIISYCIWGISLGGPFAYYLESVHSQISAQMLGGGLIMIYTLIVPLFYKIGK